MKIYWTLQSIPELTDLVPATRMAAWRACYWQSFRHYQTWVTLIILAGLVGGSIYLLGLLIFSSPVICVLLGGGISGAICGFIWVQVAVKQTRPYLRSYLESHKDSMRTK